MDPNAPTVLVVDDEEDLTELLGSYLRREHFDVVTAHDGATALGGSGIGLTIARTLVEVQGGEIRAESAGPNQGSTFSFSLPLA